jgi:hypothetical protein
MTGLPLTLRSVVEPKFLFGVPADTCASATAVKERDDVPAPAAIGRRPSANSAANAAANRAMRKKLK